MGIRNAITLIMTEFFVCSIYVYTFCLIHDPFVVVKKTHEILPNSDRQKCRKEVTGSGSVSEKVEVILLFV